MEQEQNNSPFQYVEENSIDQNVTQEEQELDTNQLTEGFVTGLPDWDLTPPYEVIRRVTRK